MKVTSLRAAFLLLVGLGLLLYSPTLPLPLFLDDASNFRWLTPTRGLHVWITAGGFPFYRPLPFTLVKLLWRVQGGYHPFTLHALSVALHLANAALVGLLARRLTRHAPAGGAAGLLMLAFPFSYQAVALVGSNFHLVLVAGVVGAALLALRYAERGSPTALVGAWAAAFAGTFSHENGVLLPFLVGLVLLAGLRGSPPLPGTRRRLALLLGPMAALAALYGVAWLLVPKVNEASGVQWGALEAKLAYFAQGAVYPLSALARPFFADEPAVVPAVGVLAVAGLAGAWAAWRWTGRRDLAGRSPALPAALAGLLWIALAAGPSVLLLPTPYLLGGPRLLYLSSVGVALFWAAWLARLWPLRTARLLGGGVLAAFVLVGALFVLGRVNDYRRLGAFYDQFIAAVQARPQTPTLLVNAPAFVAPRRGTFLLGAEGASYLSDLIAARDLLWVNTGVDYPVESVAFANTLVETEEVFSVRGPWVDWDGLDAALARADRVFTVSFAGEDFRLALVGDRLPAGIAAPPAASYDAARLAYDYANAASPPILTLRWQALAPFPQTVFVHVSCGGQQAAQFDGAPLGGLHPFERWGPGEAWADHRALLGLPCPHPDAIRVGLYHPATLERATARLPDGSTADTVTILPP
mgnify:CR=1 FL=1